MAWAYEVLRLTGLSASAASKKFSDSETLKLNATGHPAVSNIFYQYLRGGRSPRRGRRGRHGFDMVGLIERDAQAAPANRWLAHPLLGVFEEGATMEWLIETSEIASAATTSSTLIVGMEDELLDAVGKPLVLESFDDFVAVNAWMRATQMTNNYAPGHGRMLEHLSPKAAELEPAYAYIERPFMRMLQDFFLPPLWMRDDARGE